MINKTIKENIMATRRQQFPRLRPFFPLLPLSLPDQVQTEIQTQFLKILLPFPASMATMESLIGLVNRIQRACTVLGDHGGEGLSLWEALPSVAVVGGQVFSHIDFFSSLLSCLI